MLKNITIRIFRFNPKMLRPSKPPENFKPPENLNGSEYFLYILIKNKFIGCVSFILVRTGNPILLRKFIACYTYSCNVLLP